MIEQGDLVNELAEANGLSEETLREVRRQQARSVVAAEKRKVAWARFFAIGGWAATLIVVFASMWLAMLSLFRPGPDAGTWRVGLVSLAMFAMLGMIAFVVAVVASVAWYFGARTASLTAIEERLGDLESLLMTEAKKEDAADSRSG